MDGEVFITDPERERILSQLPEDSTGTKVLRINRSSLRLNRPGIAEVEYVGSDGKKTTRNCSVDYECRKE